MAKINKICKTCSSQFSVFPCRAHSAYFCSGSCARMGNKFNLGRIRTKEEKGKISQSLLGRNAGEENPNFGVKSPQWKGEKVKYPGLHNWVRRLLGACPPHCDFCGIEGKKNGRSWSIHYANKSGRYLRDLRDWLRLCTKCHRAYDAGKLQPCQS